jgi:hypothetical protein
MKEINSTLPIQIYFMTRWGYNFTELKRKKDNYGKNQNLHQRRESRQTRQRGIEETGCTPLLGNEVEGDFDGDR